MYHPLFLPKKLLIACSGIGIAMMIGLFYNAYQGMQINMNWLYVSIILNFIPFLAVIIDLIKNSVDKKSIWLIGLIALPFLTTFLYLVKRKEDIT